LAACQERRADARDPSVGTRRRRIQQPATGLRLCEQRLHLATEVDVSGAGRLEKGGTLRERSCARCVIQRLNLSGSIGGVHLKTIAQSLPCSNTTSPRMPVANLPLEPRLRKAPIARVEKSMGSPLNPLAIF
jgi:hypothetical protein